MAAAYSAVTRKLLLNLTDISSSIRLLPAFSCSIWQTRDYSSCQNSLCGSQLIIQPVNRSTNAASSRTTLALPTRCMAGHSKWQNIKRTKTAKDSERNKVFSNVANQIRAVVQATGVSDPKHNPTLARIIADAKTKNVPAANIESALEAAAKARDNSSVVYFEGRGPCGTFFIVEAFTAKSTKTKNDLQNIIKRFGASIGEPGMARHAFDKKGVIMATLSEENVDMDKYVEVAIEAGAEDVTTEKDETEEHFLKFICDPTTLMSVKGKLEGHVDIRSFMVDFLPMTTVSPPPQELEILDKLIEKMEENPDVQRVFFNVSTTDS
ncbi:probable transcriptional regulatory protein MMOB1910 [Haliotis asinina]|uniref:probable transcriptional regulatory protein MMOB1910 n=1 Tax=Haliotis asinina TaxID=109174 RepID=UPI003531A903